jgi:hypothetical protein
MIKSVFFKEWLKVRWASAAISIAFLLMLGYIYLNTSYYMRFIEPNGMWYNVVFRAMIFYGDLFIYFPLFAGIIIGVTQFIPEISSNRLKLTLHLPMKENIMLLSMLSFGTTILIIIFIITYIILAIISSTFFPVEVLWSLIITSLPWFLSGLIAYWAVAMISIEILWLVRIALLVVFLGFLNLLFYLDFYNTYSHSIIIFMFLSLFFALQTFLSSYRFRKGVL